MGRKVFFLNLIKEAIDCKISLCEFYNQFTEKEDQISNLAIERELNLNLKPPTRQAAIIFSILSRISSFLFSADLILQLFEYPINTRYIRSTVC
jgi:SUMO ligase MMS21 Smc5/6 complex component